MQKSALESVTESPPESEVDRQVVCGAECSGVPPRLGLWLCPRGAGTGWETAEREEMRQSRACKEPV